VPYSNSIEVVIEPILDAGTINGIYKLSNLKSDRSSFDSHHSYINMRDIHENRTLVIPDYKLFLQLIQA